jgi:hypothetical protein
MKSSKDYILQSIYWQNHDTNKRFFFAYSDGILLLLRVNDFPDEPLLTFINGLEILDIDDAPSCWNIPW